VHRLHAIGEPVLVSLMTATVTEEGMNRLMNAARLMRRHKFILVMCRSDIRGKEAAGLFKRAGRMSNVFCGIVEDVKSSENIECRRKKLYGVLTRSARDSASKVEV